MMYLFLSIICSVAIAVIFKINGSREVNKYAMISVNYLTAVIVSLIASINKGNLYMLFSKNTYVIFYNEFFNVLEKQHIFSPEGSVVWAIIVGCTLGATYCLSFFKYQKSIVENGMGIAAMFLRISVIIPMIISIIIWNEYPTFIQFIGLFLCLVSIITLNIDFNKISKNKINYDLLLLLIWGGLSNFSVKLYQNYALVEFKEILTLFTFLVALITSIIILFKRNRIINKNDIIVGIEIGIPNLLTVSFLVLALNYINTSVAYMLSSVSSIIIVMFIGIFFFEEKICKKDIIGVITTIIAVILLNA
nr:EamA family transporter [Sedimentibacter sp.]